MNNTLGFDLRKLVLPTGNTIEEEAKFKALIAETQEIKKELENNLEALKKTHTLYQSIFSD